MGRGLVSTSAMLPFFWQISLLPSSFPPPSSPAPSPPQSLSAHRGSHPKVMQSLHTDKKENKIFLIYREIQSGAVAKSYMRKGFLIYEEMRKYFPISEEAVSHI
jgi:hypothetical protein